MRRPFVGGNWKMNTDRAGALALAAAVADGVALDGLGIKVDIAVCPPAVHLGAVGDLLRSRGSSVKLGAQNVYPEPKGAFTGEISTAMLEDCGVAVVLTGHSERRHVLGEDDDLINRKTRAVLDSGGGGGGGLACILCIGETLAQREAGETDAVNERQLRAGLAGVGGGHLESGRLTVAYEPVWAIGTGKTATPADAQDAHAKIRAVLGSLYGPAAAGAVRVQYGGSVTPGNAPELMKQPDVDGGLIGGASLKADDFLAIVRAAAH
jgi:triosephosphate isomerase